VAQLYNQALGSSGTSGVPFPVPTIVGPWGDELPEYSYLVPGRSLCGEFYIRGYNAVYPAERQPKFQINISPL
jgi:hypothetical protein